MGEQQGPGLDRATIDQVAKLMAKARSTEYDPEAVALVERAYSLLAQVLSDYDQVSGAVGRRERRLIRDRRRGRRDRVYGERPPASPATSPTDGTERYREIAADTRRQGGPEAAEGGGTAVSL
ncbi:MAG TPA: DUF2786 domain-containing protein [Acidimicrobiales bacterium]|nr:DUF2786 domain-containing protein [Acidimicrobiales bacterium]